MPAAVQDGLDSPMSFMPQGLLSLCWPIAGRVDSLGMAFREIAREAGAFWVTSVISPSPSGSSLLQRQGCGDEEETMVFSSFGQSPQP